MPDIHISVIDPSASEKTNMEVPDNVGVGPLTEAIVEAMSLPASGPNGRPNRYQLNARDGSGRLTRLNPDQTLAQQGVTQDSSLQLTVEMVAGERHDNAQS
jgi:hypothetical protein